MCPDLPVPQCKEDFFKILLVICSFLVQIQLLSMGVMLTCKVLWDLDSQIFWMLTHPTYSSQQVRLDQLCWLPPPCFLSCENRLFWDLSPIDVTLNNLITFRTWCNGLFFAWFDCRVTVILVCFFWFSWFFFCTADMHQIEFHLAQQL